MSDEQSGPGLRIMYFKLTDDSIVKGCIHILIGLHRSLCNVCNLSGNTLFLDLDIDPHPSSAERKGFLQGGDSEALFSA